MLRKPVEYFDNKFTSKSFKEVVGRPTRNQRIRDTRMRNTKFREMVSFIIRMAEASDPIYMVKPNNPSSSGREAPAGKGLPKRSGSGSASPRVTSLASGPQEPKETDTTSVGQPTPVTLKCVGCHGNYAVDKCPDFAAWTTDSVETW
jgi:hypothetical protein